MARSELRYAVPGRAAGCRRGGAAQWTAAGHQRAVSMLSHAHAHAPPPSAAPYIPALPRSFSSSVDAIDYEAPAWVRDATWAVFFASGFSIAAVLGVYLGDASWSVSTGGGARSGPCRLPWRALSGALWRAGLRILVLGMGCPKLQMPSCWGVFEWHNPGWHTLRPLGWRLAPAPACSCRPGVAHGSWNV